MVLLGDDLMRKKIIVIGAGPSGMMAAGFAAMGDNEVILFERNERPGRKLMITGKGRCNLTNSSNMLNELIESVPVNGKFLYSAFSQFMPSDTIDFFESLSVPLKIERGNRVFPVSDKAVDVVDALYSFIKKENVKLINSRVEKLIINQGILKGIIDTKKKEYHADAVIIATGGVSYPLTGSTGDGYSLARQAGHSIISPKPSLVPLVVSDEFSDSLQGLSLKNIAIKVYERKLNRKIYSDFGELLFTHFGVSGPVVLSASSHMNDIFPGKYELHIDLKPALSHEKLDVRLLRDLKLFANKAMSNSLDKLLPKKMIPFILNLAEIPQELKANQLTKEKRLYLTAILKSVKLKIDGFRPIEEAVITSGGINVNEIDSSTMQSKIIKNLFFSGEVIDVDAYTGGFNLQIAFSTGVLAGKTAGSGVMIL